jgi:DUF4097 and DUF4098 domain-containing protein YvlB
MERTFDTPGALALDLKIPAGEIRIRAVATDITTLRIEGERDPDDLRVDLATMPDGGHRLTVEYRAKRAWGLFSFGNDLEVHVTVPLGTAVACTVGSADIEIEGRVGSLLTRVGSGDVRFEDVEGDVTLKTGSGDIAGNAASGGLTYHGASGDLTVGRVGGALVARSASGDLRIDEVGGTVQVTTVSGDLDIHSIGGPSAELRSVSGDVEVGVPAGRGVYLDISSASGDVRSDLETAPSPADGPDLDLAVSTVSGDVRVRRAPAH